VKRAVANQQQEVLPGYVGIEGLSGFRAHPQVQGGWNMSEKLDNSGGR
jgi:hypothetical protein